MLISVPANVTQLCIGPDGRNPSKASGSANVRIGQSVLHPDDSVPANPLGFDGRLDWLAVTHRGRTGLHPGHRYVIRASPVGVRRGEERLNIDCQDGTRRSLSLAVRVCSRHQRTIRKRGAGRDTTPRQ